MEHGAWSMEHGHGHGHGHGALYGAERARETAREILTSRALRGRLHGALPRPPGAACGALACPGHRGAVSNQQRHWDEQVPASMERIHGLHDDVRTRGVAREAVEHAFERADESRVAYDPHS
jgi:hypothetical protein